MISRESLTIFAATAFANDLEEAARGFFPDEVQPGLSCSPFFGAVLNPSVACIPISAACTWHVLL